MISANSLLQLITYDPDDTYDDKSSQSPQAADLIARLEVANSQYSVLIERAARLQELCDTLKQEKRRMEREQKELLHVVSHDLRNPLGLIQGYSRLLIRNANGSENLSIIEGLNVIEFSARRMNMMIQDLLNYNKPYDRQIMDLGALVGEKVQSLNGEIYQLALERGISGLEINVAYSEKPAEICADDTKLYVVLGVLTRNAAEAIIEKGNAGTIEIGLSDAFKDSVPYVCLYVRDDGCGMNEDVLEKARSFQRFSKKGRNGNGIGLPEIKKIVGRHDGIIEIDSEAGRGTEFRIYLPALAPVVSSRVNEVAYSR